MTDIVERRRHPRVAAELALNIEPPSAATVRDISRAGVRCVSRTPLQLMTSVALCLELPSSSVEGGLREVRCRGVVVRNREFEEDGAPMFEAAIAFQDLEPSTEDAIDRFIFEQFNSQAD